MEVQSWKWTLVGAILVLESPTSQMPDLGFEVWTGEGGEAHECGEILPRSCWTISVFGGHPDMGIALALRTIIFPTGSLYNTMYSYRGAKQSREWVVHLQAGAGIVADSVPADEQQECKNKAAALAHAIDLAESAFLEQ
ncbi:hypothetical protein LUZ63_001020 [Rhynchospora breviuscula]|uniref:Chorismate-utilising enzyme C-terminal domain-containing protein n=1 Tax=Rhynchospora breviuscula TaxID=2022672 RepID=A0A9Q0CW32_9POAL|nr:hypothetical protein LUZ63_001020 [Rhynchospora breviuscula]